MPLYCQFAVASGSGAIEREGVIALPELAEPVKRVQQVVLLLAPSDVTLLQVKMPPLSGGRLKAALPNMVEDQLMSDPAQCVMIAGEMRDGTRTVAVVDRAWLELLNRTLQALGARSAIAVPSQLCLPHQADTISAAVSEHGTDIEVAVRLAEEEGLGLAIVADQPESAAFETVQALSAMAPHAPINLYVSPSRLRDYQDSLHLAPTLEQRITLHADDWHNWIAGADRSRLNLMAGLGMTAGPKVDWQRWRWPLVLGAAVLMVNVIGLNIDWLRLKREADALRTGMIQTYKTAYPKESVSDDPLAQLRQKLAAAQRDSGQMAPDDFVALVAAFGEAWASTGQGTPPIASLEYRDRSLTVKVKPDSAVSTDQLTNALASRNLSIAQPSTGVWQIRSNK